MAFFIFQTFHRHCIFTLMVVLRWMYTIWGVCLFAALLLLTAPLFLLFALLLGQKSIGILLFLCRFIGWGLSVGLCIPILRHGNKKVDHSQAYVVIANHRSNWDAPVAAVSTWGIVRFLAKKELLKVPVMGQVFKYTAVNVDRSSPESRRKSMSAMAAYLHKGESVFLFPEGTRNKTKDQVMLPFKDGAFRLAIELQVPLLPLVYTHTDRVFPNKPMLLKPGITHIYYHDPIPTLGLTLQDLPALKEQVRQFMIDRYLEYVK